MQPMEQESNGIMNDPGTKATLHCSWGMLIAIASNPLCFT